MISRLLASALIAMLTLFLSSCETTDSASTSQQPAAASVPGEKAGGGAEVTPNMSSGVPGASVGW